MEVSKPAVSPVGGEERVIPRYLRASTGSCHDFCKYGRKQPFEKEGRHEARHKQPSAKAKHDSIKSFIAANRRKIAVKQKKVSGAKLKSSHGTTVIAPNPPVLTKPIDSDECGEKTPSPRFSSSGSSELFAVVQRNDGLHVEENQASQLVRTINEEDASPVEKIDHNNVPSDKLHDGPNDLDATFSSVNRNIPSEQLETIEVEIIQVPDLAIIKESEPFSQLDQTYPPEEIKEVKQVMTTVCEGALTMETKVIHRNVPSAKRSESPASPKVKQTISPASRIQGSSPNPKTNMGKLPRKSLKPSEVKSASPLKKLTASEMKSNISPTPTRVSIASSRMISTASTGKKTVVSAMRKSRPSLNVPSVQASKLNGKDKVSKKPVLPKMEEKKVLCPTRLSPSMPPNNQVPALSALNLRNHREDKSSERTRESVDNVKEKTIYVVKPTEETVNPIDSNDQWSSPSMPSSSSSSLGSSFDDGQDESLDGCSKIHAKDDDDTFSDCEMDNDQHESLYDVGKKQKLGKAALEQSEDPDPHKVKFRRGKRVDVHSADSGPRRLKFRQGRMLDDNQKGNAGHRKGRFRKKEIVGHDSVPKPRTEVVMLRHQDVQDRKDTQGLFNDVIEVTASKLVEARKSKVKALVGAFETVISLQESKPASLLSSVT